MRLAPVPASRPLNELLDQVENENFVFAAIPTQDDMGPCFILALAAEDKWYPLPSDFARFLTCTEACACATQINCDDLGLDPIAVTIFLEARAYELPK